MADPTKCVANFQGESKALSNWLKYHTFSVTLRCQLVWLYLFKECCIFAFVCRNVTFQVYFQCDLVRSCNNSLHACEKQIFWQHIWERVSVSHPPNVASIVLPSLLFNPSYLLMRIPGRLALWKSIFPREEWMLGRSLRQLYKLHKMRKTDSSVEVWNVSIYLFVKGYVDILVIFLLVVTRYPRRRNWMEEEFIVVHHSREVIVARGWGSW